MLTNTICPARQHSSLCDWQDIRPLPQWAQPNSSWCFASQPDPWRSWPTFIWTSPSIFPCSRHNHTRLRCKCELDWLVCDIVLPPHFLQLCMLLHQTFHHAVHSLSMRTNFTHTANHDDHIGVVWTRATDSPNWIRTSERGHHCHWVMLPSDRL